MTALTADQIASKWSANLGAATTTIQAGIEAVKTAPGQAAARQQSAYVAGVQASAGKWAANVGKVSLSDWQQAAIGKGIPRIATGATAAQSKMTAFFAKLLPFQQSLINQLPARGTTDQNIARAVAFMRGMTQFSNS